MEITDINQLDINGTYTYADYLLWKFQERVELFKGKIFKMSPAPNTRHQKVSFNLGGMFYNFFRNKKCKVYVAPFDVRLPNKDGEIKTVVQPDLCVICDINKIDDKGCVGAPDLVIEIISPGNSKKELNNKFALYEEAGVLEYWVVQPEYETVLIYILENGKYKGLSPVADGEVISVTFPDLKIPLEQIFEN